MQEEQTNLSPEEQTETLDKDDDVVSIDLTSSDEELEEADEDAKQGKLQFEEHKEDEKATSEKKSFELDAIRRIIREEVVPKGKEPDKASAGPMRFSDADLDQAEDELYRKHDEGEISEEEYRRLSRLITRMRIDNAVQEQVERHKQVALLETVEKGISSWAEQNIPEALNTESGLYKTTEQFLAEVIGARKSGQGYVVPEKALRVLGAVVVKARLNEPAKQKEPEQGSRKREMMAKQPLKGAPGASSEKEKLTPREQEILSQLGLRKDKAYLYKRFKYAGRAKKDVDIQD